jgi:hypothetical protein
MTAPVRKMLCVSCDCPDREACTWRHYTFAEIKAAKDSGQSRDRFQQGEVCPKALHRALHGYQDAPKRWAARIATGLTDADLREAIAKEFGEWSGSSWGPGHTAMASGPSIWFGTRGNRKPDLQGKALVAVVREFLEVPLPKAAQKDAAPWAGLPLMKMMEARG